MAMARNQRGSNNNNNEGRNQYSSGVVDYARERPATAAVAAAAAVGAGVFLWSRRSQITEQLSGISDQIGQWSEKMTSSQGQQNQQFETANASTGTPGSNFGQSETGGGNATLGAQTGGTGTTGSF
jgi:hypothetical protein